MQEKHNRDAVHLKLVKVKRLNSSAVLSWHHLNSPNTLYFITRYLCSLHSLLILRSLVRKKVGPPVSERINSDEGTLNVIKLITFPDDLSGWKPTRGEYFSEYAYAKCVSSGLAEGLRAQSPAQRGAI